MTATKVKISIGRKVEADAGPLPARPSPALANRTGHPQGERADVQRPFGRPSGAGGKRGGGGTNASAPAARAAEAAPPAASGGDSPGTGGANTTAAAVNAPTSDGVGRRRAAADQLPGPIPRHRRTRRSRSTAGSRTASPATPTVDPRMAATSASSPTGGPTSGKGNQYYLVVRADGRPEPRHGQLRRPVRHPLRQRLGVHQELRPVRSRVQAQLVQRPRPAADVRRGPPAGPDQERPRHPRRPVLSRRPASRTSRRSSGRCSRSPTCSTTPRSPCSGSSRRCTSTSGLNLYNGAVNGWDRWIDQNYRYSYLGGFSYNSRDLKTAVTSIVLTGPDQLPRFAPANSPFLPTGVVTDARRSRAGQGQPVLRRELPDLPESTTS